MRILSILLLATGTVFADGVTHHISPDYEVQDGLGVIYVRVGRERVARMVSAELAAKLYPDAVLDGKITAGDAWLAGADAPVGRMLSSSARRALYEVLPAVTFLGHDQLGSVTVETSDQGEVIGRRAWYPFGSARASTGDADRYGFTGQEADATGMLHFAFRQLDPASGRWASADPLFSAASAGGIGRLGESSTAYAYVGNRVANFIDPTGLGNKPSKGSGRRAPAERPSQDADNNNNNNNNNNAPAQEHGPRLARLMPEITRPTQQDEAAWYATYQHSAPNDQAAETARTALNARAFAARALDQLLTAALNSTAAPAAVSYDELLEATTGFYQGAREEGHEVWNDFQQVNRSLSRGAIEAGYPVWDPAVQKAITWAATAIAQLESTGSWMADKEDHGGKLRR
jgi:RHS repeat-associated protein